ncbi:MAG: LysM peptidoglycan-binding domain-containing protein [Acidobacteriota bacterium]|nr:LysM peptidoglycan-binding domain-containing protein [Acidobacteriota bacterium]
MKVRLSGLCLIALLAGASALAARDRPPENLHRVGDHWTAWDPPTPATGAPTYVIVRGDTLWDLAKRFYGNPYLWPQLWEKNRYILDAHWIYPGDPLATGVEVAPVDSLSSATGGGTPSSPGEEPMPAPEVQGVMSSVQATGAPVPLGSESDIYCTGFIGDPDQKFPLAIAGSEYEALHPSTTFLNMKPIQGAFGPVNTAKYDLSAGDIVYLNGGRAQGLSPGQQFTVVEKGRKVIHPIRHDVVGRFYQYLGRVRVLSVQDDSAIGEIAHSCSAIHKGSLLQPFEPVPVPLARPTAMRPVNLPPAAEKLREAPVILLARDDIFTVGQDSVVLIDRLDNQDLTPGDIFTIYRLHDGNNFPPVLLGELAVLSVHAHSAVAKIIQSRYPIYVGDRLDPK